MDPDGVAGPKREHSIDALRGLMLVLITVTHVPTRFGEWIGQPFGYVSAAEGFVFLSAYLVGQVYGRRAIREGPGAMRRALWRRAGVIYLCQAGMLIFLFTVIAAIGLKTGREATTNLMSFYMHEPLTALWTGLLLVYNPPLLDILPMYVLLMLLSPVLLTIGMRRHGWAVLIAASLLLWLAVQFGLTQAFYARLFAAIHSRVPLHQMGAFELTAWQLVWMLGLWLGASHVAEPRPAAPRFPPALLALAATIAITSLAWRHGVGQTPFPGQDSMNLLLDKWRLGPFRLVNFLALMAVTIALGRRLRRDPSLPFLELLGRHSLPVFCAHLVYALLMLALIGDRPGTLPMAGEVLVLAGAFAALYVAAWLSAQVGRNHRRPEPVALGVEMKSVT